MQKNTIQYYAIQFNTVQYNSIQSQALCCLEYPTRSWWGDGTENNEQNDNSILTPHLSSPPPLHFPPVNSSTTHFFRSTVKLTRVASSKLSILTSMSSLRKRLPDPLPTTNPPTTQLQQEVNVVMVLKETKDGHYMLVTQAFMDADLLGQLEGGGDD